jgi:hypothetical protein
MGRHSDLHSSRIACEALRQLSRAECDPGYQPRSLEDLKLAALAQLAAALDAEDDAIGSRLSD